MRRIRSCSPGGGSVDPAALLLLSLGRVPVAVESIPHDAHLVEVDLQGRELVDSGLLLVGELDAVVQLGGGHEDGVVVAEVDGDRDRERVRRRDLSFFNGKARDDGRPIGLLRHLAVPHLLLDPAEQVRDRVAVGVARPDVEDAVQLGLAVVVAPQNDSDRDKRIARLLRSEELDADADGHALVPGNHVLEEPLDHLPRGIHVVDRDVTL
mmetsp:Transcript_23541/g.93307  ORF Transcript_23541/g.93307 Transcript_23541/m.93307 type:complete len:210 (-) Transcript_23541:630-1259(-)